MSIGKWLHRHVKQVEHLGRESLSVGQKMNPMGGAGGGMFGMGGAPQQSATSDPNAADPNAQARADAAQAMKRQAGGAQISFTGNNETPSSQV